MSNTENFDIFYYKPKNRSFLESLEKTVERSQNYVPIYQSFFDLNETNYNSISFNHKYHIIAEDKVYEMNESPEESTQKRNIFIKYSPILDPIKYMIGKYNISDPRIRALPKYNSTTDNCLAKVLDLNNSSYIDGFFTYLTSQLLNHHKIVHGVDYYGSFMGIQRDFKMNVVEDLDYLEESDFFHRNVGKLFVVDNPYNLTGGGETDAATECGGYLTESDNSRKIKKPIHLVKDEEHNTSVSNIELELDELEGGEDAPAPENDTSSSQAPLSAELIEEFNINNEEVKDAVKLKRSCSRSTTSNSSNSSLNYTTDEEEGEDSGKAAASERSAANSDDESNMSDESSIDDENDGSGSEDDDCSSDEDVEIMATIYNFPVHMICLEKCDGTLDDLMAADKLSDEEWRSALFQVIMTLNIYQKTFHLTHNDLHTNNIMYVNTKEKHIYYLFNKKHYKVPTYGKIYKIIDYGRAIYKYRGKLFCSDSFDFLGDAATQYNFMPYYNDKKPIIEPNYSFDLCRLGCSIYDCVIGDYEEKDVKDFSEFQKLILEWCMDDNGKNILYKKNGEERYPSFKLYKMIARNVHNHTPVAQLKRAFFKKYECGRGMGEVAATRSHGIFMDIDKLPCYA